MSTNVGEIKDATGKGADILGRFNDIPGRLGPILIKNRALVITASSL